SASITLSRPPPSTLLAYTTLFRSPAGQRRACDIPENAPQQGPPRAHRVAAEPPADGRRPDRAARDAPARAHVRGPQALHRRLRRSEEHTSELQSHLNLVCRLLLQT